MGFTLLELIVTLLIIALLAMVALPSYTQYVVRTHRADAQEALTQMMFEQERYRLRTRQYTLDLRALGYALDQYRGVASSEGFYSVVAQPCQMSVSISRCIELEARPTPDGLQARAGEAPIALNSLGQQRGEWP